MNGYTPKPNPNIPPPEYDGVTEGYDPFFNTRIHENGFIKGFIAGMTDTFKLLSHHSYEIGFTLGFVSLLLSFFICFGFIVFAIAG